MIYDNYQNDQILFLYSLDNPIVADPDA